MKKIVAFLFVILTVISLFPLSAFAGDAQTGILGDLQRATIGGSSFDPDDYPKKDGADPEFFSLMERGYTYSGNQSAYRMEIYIYNPSEKVIVTGGKNTIQMAVKFDENGVAESFEKFDLQFIEKTENNRFYQFAVIDHVSSHDGNKIVQRVDRAARRYTVSGFEVQFVGDADGSDFPIGKTFVFTGFESDKNLSVKTGLVETIDLDVHQTYWRSQTSSLGEGHQNQLSSVYFAVPNVYFEKYGVLQAVKAAWNEQRTSPVIVVDNQSICNGLYSQIGIHDSTLDDQNSFGFYRKKLVSDSAAVISNFDYIYNADTSDLLLSVYRKYIHTLGYAFYDDEITGADIGVSGNVLTEHIQNKKYADWLFADFVDDGRTKGYQEQTIYDDELLNLKTFGSTHDWFTTWLRYTLKGVDAYEDLKNIPPIYEVKASDLTEKKAVQIAGNLYVAENDVADLCAAYADATAADSRLMLFRFAATDYYAEEITHFFMNGNEVDCQGYAAEETVFLDFDIISLTFYKDDVSTVIPVASDPQDVIGAITSPNVPDNFDWGWFKRLIMLAAMFILIVVCWNPLMMVMDTTIKLLTDRRGKK